MNKKKSYFEKSIINLIKIIRIQQIHNDWCIMNQNYEKLWNK